MKKTDFLCMAFALCTCCFAQSIFINEIHYDNEGGDLEEGLEIAGPAGVDISGWTIYF